MKALLLAAGEGRRMQPLTLTTPKPLIKIDQYSLIEHLLFSLQKAGFSEMVINIAYHRQQFLDTLGDGTRYGVKITYAMEPENAPLETGGAMLNALPLLGNSPFLAISGDLWTDYPWQQLPRQLTGLAHLVLVDNPAHHVHGDFTLQNGLVSNQGTPKFNFAGIGVYHPDLFHHVTPGRFSIVPLLIAAMAKKLVAGEFYKGIWKNIGTLPQLDALRAEQTQSIR